MPSIPFVTTGGSVLVLSNRPGLPALAFDVGAMLAARVVSRDGDRITLSLRDRLIQCRTDLDLPPGSSVNLLVRDVRPDRIMLTPVLSAKVPGGAEEVLQSLGLPSSPEAVLVAKSLLIQGKPLEEGLFRHVLQSLSHLDQSSLAGEEAERIVDAVAFLVATGRPVTDETVQAVLAVNTPEPDLGSLFAGLAGALRAAQELYSPLAGNESEAPLVGAQEPVVALPPDLASDLKQLDDLLSDLTYQPLAGENPRQGAERLEELVTRLGHTYERSLATPAAQGEGSDPAATLKGLLLKLRTRLAEGEPLDGPLAQVARKVSETLDNLNGQHLVAKGPDRPGQPPIEMLLQLPVQTDSGVQTAEIRVYVDEERRRQGQQDDAFRVSFRLTTENLGSVRLDLNLRGKRIDCRLILANEEVISLMRDHQPELEAALGSAGFSLGAISYANRKDDKPARPDPPLTKVDLQL